MQRLSCSSSQQPRDCQDPIMPPVSAPWIRLNGDHNRSDVICVGSKTYNSDMSQTTSFWGWMPKRNIYYNWTFPLATYCTTANRMLNIATRRHKGKGVKIENQRVGSPQVYEVLDFLLPQEGFWSFAQRTARWCRKITYCFVMHAPVRDHSV